MSLVQDENGEWHDDGGGGMTMRDKIASELARHFHEPNGQILSAADGIIAALPGIIPDLVWAGFGKECVRAESVLGRYEIMWGFPNGQYTLDCPKAARNHEWHPSSEAAKAAANAHHRAAMCKAMGWVE